MRLNIRGNEEPYNCKWREQLIPIYKSHIFDETNSNTYHIEDSIHQKCDLWNQIWIDWIVGSPERFFCFLSVFFNKIKKRIQ